MIAAGTVEEKMYEKQVFKDGIRRSVLDEGGSTSTERYFESDELRNLFTLGDRGVCGVMEKIACYGIPFDSQGQEFVLRHSGTVGLSRHDVFYNLAKGLGAPPPPPSEVEDEPLPPSVLGRSARVLQQNNRDDAAGSPGENLVPLGGGARKNEKKKKAVKNPAAAAAADVEVLECDTSSDDDDDEHGGRPNP